MLSCKRISCEMSDAVGCGCDWPWFSRLKMNLHLAFCGRCRRLKRSLDRTVDLLNCLKAEPPIVPDEKDSSGT